MGKKASEGEIGNIQQTMDEQAMDEQTIDQQPATVQFLDSTKHIFYVSVSHSFDSLKSRTEKGHKNLKQKFI